MSINRFPVGLEMDISYPDFQVSLTLLSGTQLVLEIKDGPFARTETVDIHVVPLGNSIFAVSWQEKDGTTVTAIQDYDSRVVHSFTTLPNNSFLSMTGSFLVTWPAVDECDHYPKRNRALVLEAMTSLFQRRDASAVKKLYANNCIQHCSDISKGRDALQTLVTNLPENFYYEPSLMIAENDLVAILGRMQGLTDATKIVVDIFRIENGKLAEHWDVSQDEVPDGVLTLSEDTCAIQRRCSESYSETVEHSVESYMT